MKKNIIFWRRMILSLVLLVLSGCGGPGTFFMLTGPTAGKHYVKQLPVIGVEKISLPEYMKQKKIAIQLSPTQIHYSDSGEWAEDMEDSLTKQLIVTIQRSFNHPDVYRYPWDLSQQAGIKIKVTVSRFIAYHDFVYLDATLKISELQRNRKYSRLFSVKVPCRKDTASIVAAMNRAFGQLSQAIVDGLEKGHFD